MVSLTSMLHSTTRLLPSQIVKGNALAWATSGGSGFRGSQEKVHHLLPKLLLSDVEMLLLNTA